jgi:hypothetical protein
LENERKIGNRQKMKRMSHQKTPIFISKTPVFISKIPCFHIKNTRFHVKITRFHVKNTHFHIKIPCFPIKKRTRVAVAQLERPKQRGILNRPPQKGVWDAYFTGNLPKMAEIEQKMSKK